MIRDSDKGAGVSFANHFESRHLDSVFLIYFVETPIDTFPGIRYFHFPELFRKGK
jgi:hypothetical protein